MVVSKMVDPMKVALENATMNLIAVQTRMKEYADKSMWSKIFHKGTRVLLSTKNL